MKKLFTVCLVLTLLNLNAQKTLKDTLRIHDTATTVLKQDSWVKLRLGDKLPQFYFYDTLGNKIFTDSLFKSGKQVIFITGSYTCPGFRHSVPQINKLVSTLSSTATVYVVYVKEAHPLKNSPYGTEADNLQANKRKHIRVKQQRFVEERIRWAKKAKRGLILKANVLIDNENNSFFNTVFAGPNGCLVFSVNQNLEAQQLWLKNNPQQKEE